MVPRGLVIALVIVSASACATDRGPFAQRYDPAAPTPPPPPPPTPLGSPGCGKAAAAGARSQHVTVTGRDRTYTLVVPDGYEPASPYPLFVVLHGGGGNAAGARGQTDLESVAAGRALFVYPQGAGPDWDLDSDAATNADVAFFDLLLLTIHNTLCLDARRVFVTGFSNGAYMANQLACRRGDRIRGVITHSGGGPYELHGTYDAQGHLVCPGKSVASLVIHGTNDTTVAPSEGDKSLDHWSFANRCGTNTEPRWTPPCIALSSCHQPVGVCRIPGLAHATWKETGRATWAFAEALR